MSDSDTLVGGSEGQFGSIEIGELTNVIRNELLKSWHHVWNSISVAALHLPSETERKILESDVANVAVKTILDFPHDFVPFSYPLSR